MVEERVFYYATVAQLVEHVAEDHGVGGSSPPGSTIMVATL